VFAPRSLAEDPSREKEIGHGGKQDARRVPLTGEPLAGRKAPAAARARGGHQQHKRPRGGAGGAGVGGGGRRTAGSAAQGEDRDRPCDDRAYPRGVGAQQARVPGIIVAPGFAGIVPGSSPNGAAANSQRASDPGSGPSALVFSPEGAAVNSQGSQPLV